jgi:hypothetical protein
MGSSSQRLLPSWQSPELGHIQHGAVTTTFSLLVGEAPAPTKFTCSQHLQAARAAGRQGQQHSQEGQGPVQRQQDPPAACGAGSRQARQPLEPGLPSESACQALRAYACCCHHLLPVALAAPAVRAINSGRIPATRPFSRLTHPRHLTPRAQCSTTRRPSCWHACSPTVTQQRHRAASAQQQPQRTHLQPGDLPPAWRAAHAPPWSLGRPAPRARSCCVAWPRRPRGRGRVRGRIPWARAPGMWVPAGQQRRGGLDDGCVECSKSRSGRIEGGGGCRACKGLAGSAKARPASQAKAAAPASTAALSQAAHLVRPALGGPVRGRGGLRRAPLRRPGGGSSGSCWSRCCALPLLLVLLLLLLLLLGRLHLRREPHVSGPRARQGEHAVGARSACWAPITQDLRAVAACMHHAWQPAPSRLPAIRACPPALPCALPTHPHPQHARLVSHPPSRSRRCPPARGQRQQRWPQLPCG